MLWRVFGRGQAASAGRVQSVAVRMVVRARARPDAVPCRAVDDLEGRRSSRQRSGRSGAALVELDGRRLAEGRDFDPATGQLAQPRPRRRRRAARRRRGRRRSPTGSATLRSRSRRVESDPFTERPRAPFTTSTLQQESSRKLRFGAARTMSIAQRLYERGLHHLHANRQHEPVGAGDHRGAHRDPRAVRRRVPAGRAARVSQQGEERAGSARSDPSRRRRHPHTRCSCAPSSTPTSSASTSWCGSARSRARWSDARGRKTTLRLAATSTANERATFRAAGKTYDFLGWRRVYVEDVDEGEEQENEARLPVVAEGESVACNELAPVAHETKPPARYTEASLVKELEERGIGRPSTYAAVIETIQARGYVWRKGTALVPDWTAFARHEPARAALRPPRRLRLHRDDGRGARRHRAWRGRSREVARTPSTSGTAHPGLRAAGLRRAARRRSTRAA